MKYKKMNDGIFKFLCLHAKYFLRVFTFCKNYSHGAWFFYNAMMRIFILMQVLKVNMQK
jgi:hypothetical protein